MGASPLVRASKVGLRLGDVPVLGGELEFLVVELAVQALDARVGNSELLGAPRQSLVGRVVLGLPVDGGCWRAGAGAGGEDWGRDAGWGRGAEEGSARGVRDERGLLAAG